MFYHGLGHSLNPVLGTPGREDSCRGSKKAGQTLFAHLGLQAWTQMRLNAVLLLIYVSHLLGQTLERALSTCILIKRAEDVSVNVDKLYIQRSKLETNGEE